MKPLRLYMEGEKVICAFTLHMDIRRGDEELLKEILLRGLHRMEGEYETDAGHVEVGVRVELADKFSFGAVNVRVEDKIPVVRKWYSPKLNVSRAYLGTRRRGALKLARYVWKMPDVFINTAGRDMEDHRCQAVVCSIVQHEFGHVLGFRDKYKYKHNKFSKSSLSVGDGDIMFRVGTSQRFMEYHIKRLKECAKKGRLPFRSV